MVREEAAQHHGHGRRQRQEPAQLPVVEQEVLKKKKNVPEKGSGKNEGRREKDREWEREGERGMARKGADKECTDDVILMPSSSKFVLDGLRDERTPERRRTKTP